MLKQLSVFTENQKGAMLKITSLLQDGNINIMGSVTNDSAEYGIVRMVLSDPDKAYKLLSDKGYICRISNVLGIEIKDEVGSLNNLLLAIKDSNIAIDYLYLSFSRSTGNPIMVFSVEDTAEVEIALTSRGFVSVSE